MPGGPSEPQIAKKAADQRGLAGIAAGDEDGAQELAV
jgi:hypothetical protein